MITIHNVLLALSLPYGEAIKIEIIVPSNAWYQSSPFSGNGAEAFAAYFILSIPIPLSFPRSFLGSCPKSQ